MAEGRLRAVGGSLWSGPEAIGRAVIGAIEQVGDAVLLLVTALVWTIRPPFRLAQFIYALYFVGVGSLFIVALTGLFSGGVMALQIGLAFRLFNAETLTGPTVALALARELSPVFTALMVTARVGSAMATEIGTMRVTEQIDALKTMAVHPVHYLVTPRIIASVLMLPVLTMFFNLVGMLGCWFVAVRLLGIDPGFFVERVRQYVTPSDLTNGLVKAAVFGVVLSTVGCFKGFTAAGGARGVGQATTQAVVYSAVLILILDYFLTVLMF